jgi:hypothetical protein
VDVFALGCRAHLLAVRFTLQLITPPRMYCIASDGSCVSSLPFFSLAGHDTARSYLLPQKYSFACFDVAFFFTDYLKCIPKMI